MLSKILAGMFRKLFISNSYKFGAVRFGPNVIQEMPLVPFKHPHIGKVKLFYVDTAVRDKLAGGEE